MAILGEGSQSPALADGSRRWMPLLLVLVTSLLATVATLVAWSVDEQVVDEDHFVEWTQAALLLMAAVVQGGRAVVKRSTTLDMLVRAALAMLCASMVLREVDVERLAGETYGTASEWTLRGLVVVGWLVYAAYAVPRRDFLWSQRRQVLRSWCGAFSAAGVALYLLSLPFDKQIFPLAEFTTKLIEQGVLQLNATICFFAAAAITAPLVANHARE